MHPVIERRLVLMFAVVCAAEVAFVLTSWFVNPLTILSGPAIAPAVDGRESAKLPVLEKPPLKSFAAFIERPLFTAARRPPPAASGREFPTTSREGSTFLGRYRLTGVVVTPTIRIAFVTDLSSSKNLAVTEGEKLGDWVLAKIDRHSITLQSGERRETFAFETSPDRQGASR